MILRRAFGALLALLTFGTVLVVTAAPSQAAVACSGTITYSYAYPESNPVAELVIYYNSTNGGTNSACMYHRGASYGVSAQTSVQVAKCAETSGSGACTVTAASSTDNASYAYYAGPRGVTGTANNCVDAYGEIDWAGTTYWIHSGRQGC